MRQPEIAVGIVSRDTIAFTLSGIYSGQGTDIITGRHEVSLSPGGTGVVWNGTLYPSLEFVPSSYEGDTFTLEGVTIGVDFHWERREDQLFRGTLRIIPNGSSLTAINLIGVEDYLVSVISSEMSSSCSLALLRAHAIISRSWVLAQMEHKTGSKSEYRAKGMENVKWWDHDDHSLFDVCADDHCQRYQGVGRVKSPNVLSAVTGTRGTVLTYDGERLCDTRFSKCCGGVMERFSSCWEDTDYPYLQIRRDAPDTADFPDLTVEENALRWIENSPEAFCNTSDTRIISQVLNNYDREHTDFYRWEETYTQERISRLVNSRLETDLGEITDLIPVERGGSGRIVRLLITGTKGKTVIGKELFIRRVLSESHLRSSAFTVEKIDISPEGVPAQFRLHGAGWGHGVGLCQIGAAVMGEKGYSSEDILRHYYPGAKLTILY